MRRRVIPIVIVVGGILLAACNASPDEPEVATPTPRPDASRAPAADAAPPTGGSSPVPVSAAPSPAATAVAAALAATVEPTPARAVAVVVEAATPATVTRQQATGANPKRVTELTPPDPKPPRSTPTPSTLRAEGASDEGKTKIEQAEVAYTWYDGDRTMQVWLRDDLVVQPTSENTADDVVVSRGSEWSIVERQARHETSGAGPVFRTSSGSLMTLPGGVILVLDSSWDQSGVDAFFAAESISPGDVTAQTFAVNAFLVETDPGFPSLELANELAVLDGVLISSPNWRREVATR